VANKDDSSQFLFGSATSSAKFPTPGTTVSGTVTDRPTQSQQTDPKDGSLQTWDNGQPKLQLIVKLQTGNPDLNDPDDDGVRALYVKGKNLTAAVRDAVKAAGAKSLEVGGKLSVTYTGDGEKTNKAFNPPKEYSATYAAPNASEDFLADPWASAEEPAKTNGLSAAQQAALEAAGLA
jgi:hypothetical protein